MCCFGNRYPYEVMCVMSKPSQLMLWSRYTLWIPLYVVTVIIEGFTIYEAIPYFEPEVPCPPSQDSAGLMDTCDSMDLQIYLSLLVLGATVSLWQLVKERRYQMEKWSKKLKKKWFFYWRTLPHEFISYTERGLYIECEYHDLYGNEMIEQHSVCEGVPVYTRWSKTSELRLSPRH